MAWQDILGQEDVRSTLVVAHNAVNQALLNTVLSLPPDFFRRLLQSNGATSVIDFQPNGDGPPTCTIDRINQVTSLIADLWMKHDTLPPAVSLSLWDNTDRENIYTFSQESSHQALPHSVKSKAL